jgi:hypothetical protein
VELYLHSPISLHGVVLSLAQGQLCLYLTIEENTEVSLEINAEKTKCIIISCHPNSGQKQDLRIADESFENVAELKYLGTTLTNQNDIHDEIKSRLNSGNACYHSVQNLLSSRLIQKN